MASKPIDSGQVQAASNTDSKATPEKEQDAHSSQPSAQIAGSQDSGNIPALAIAGDTHDLGQESRARARGNDLVRRFMREGRWPEVVKVRDAMMRECLVKHMPKTEAQAWTYAELDRRYPPLPVKASHALAGETLGNRDQESKIGRIATSGEGRVHGLSDIPPGWPELPANASLAAEIGWVQAERLRIVEEKPGGPTVVSLGKARSPAPSWSALSWLETSIRSYAKYVEVAAKAASTATDEQANVRRERMAIEDIRALLEEMLVAK